MISYPFVCNENDVVVKSAVVFKNEVIVLIEKGNGVSGCQLFIPAVTDKPSGAQLLSDPTGA